MKYADMTIAMAWIIAGTIIATAVLFWVSMYET
jgi:hypothetical protein